MRELLEFKTFFTKKSNSLFEEYFLVSDSGGNDHINLHFVQLFTISSKTKTASSESWKQNPSIPPRAPLRVRSLIACFTKLLAACCFSARVTSNTFYLELQCTLKGIHGTHHVPSQHLKRVGSFSTRKTCWKYLAVSKLHVSKALLVFHKTIQQRNESRWTDLHSSQLGTIWNNTSTALRASPPSP